MAKPVSEEELQLKKRARRRLIGAIVLVAAVAAVLPMVLDSEPKATSQDINIQIPSPDAKGGFTAKAVPAAKAGAKPEVKEPAVTAPPPAERVTQPAEAPKDAAVTPVPKDAAVAPAPKPVEKPPAKAAEKTTEKLAEKAAEKPPEKAAEKTAAVKPAPGTFFIQVTALSDTEKANQIKQQIADAGVRSYTEVVAAGKGNVTRVRAGPFASREEAEQARARLATVGLEGKVTAH
jgi:DedD protein